VCYSLWHNAPTMLPLSFTGSTASVCSHPPNYLFITYICVLTTLHPRTPPSLAQLKLQLRRDASYSEVTGLMTVESGLMLGNVKTFISVGVRRPGHDAPSSAEFQDVWGSIPTPVPPRLRGWLLAT